MSEQSYLPFAFAFQLFEPASVQYLAREGLETAEGLALCVLYRISTFYSIIP